MLEFKKMTISDRETIQSYLNIDGAFMSERNFNSLFLWANHYKIQFCIEEETLYIVTDFYKDYFLMFPPLTKGDFKTAVLKILNYAKANYDVYKFNTVSEKQKEQMISAFGEQAFQFADNRDSMDYIYQSENLMWLKGKKLSAKRNHINKFNAKYEGLWTYQAIDPVKDFDEIIMFQENWSKSKGSEDIAETTAIKTALTYFTDMNLQGGILRVQDKMVGFTIGGKISDMLYGVFFEKALTDVDGAYTVINQQFAQANFDNIPFVNREEDLGIEGLRKAKLSYYPYELTHKYVVTPNDSYIFK